MAKKLLGIEIKKHSKSDILDKIINNAKKREKFIHILSLNPENLVDSRRNFYFKEVVKKAQIQIIDGVGVTAAGNFLKVPIGERLTGVDLMSDFLKLASRYSLRVQLIGGKPKIADEVVRCQKLLYPKLEIRGLEGIKNIKHPKREEESRIFSIVSAFKPHLVFVAFGSPYQEIWIYRNRRGFRGTVVMGVGGAFDYLSGRIPRAPKILRKIGLEWLFRLILEPWRIKRQIKLLEFIFLVLRQKLSMS